jgi:hypothetical protein
VAVGGARAVHVHVTLGYVIGVPHSSVVGISSTLLLSHVSC